MIKKKTTRQFRYCDTVCQNLLMLKTCASPIWVNEHPWCWQMQGSQGTVVTFNTPWKQISLLSDKLCNLIAVWSLLEAGRLYICKPKFFFHLYQQELYWYYLLKNQAASHTFILLCFCQNNFWAFNSFHWNSIKTNA